MNNNGFTNPTNGWWGLKVWSRQVENGIVGLVSLAVGALLALAGAAVLIFTEKAVLYLLKLAFRNVLEGEKAIKEVQHFFTVFEAGATVLPFLLATGMLIVSFIHSWRWLVNYASDFNNRPHGVGNP